MTETFTCDTPGVCIKGLLFREQDSFLRELRATRYELRSHQGGDPDVLDQLRKEARIIAPVERFCLRSALSGGRCPGGGAGACGAVFKI